MKKITIFFMITFFILISGKNLSLELSLNHFFSSDFNYYYDDFDKEARELVPYTVNGNSYFYLYENYRIKFNYKINLKYAEFNISPVFGNYDKKIYLNKEFTKPGLNNMTLLVNEKNLVLFLLELSAVSKIRIGQYVNLKIGFIYNIRYFPDTKKVYFENRDWTFGYLDNIYFEFYLKNYFKFISFERFTILEFLSEKKINFGFILYRTVINLSSIHISLDGVDYDPHQDDYSSDLSAYFSYKYKNINLSLVLSLDRLISSTERKYYKIFPINFIIGVDL